MSERDGPVRQFKLLASLPLIVPNMQNSSAVNIEHLFSPLKTLASRT